MTLRIRRAEPADLEAIVAVHAHAVRELSNLHYTARELAAWTDQFRGDFVPSKFDECDVCVSFDEAHSVVGFGVLDPAKSEIVSLYVHPSSARTGVGKALLQHLEEAARTRGLVRLHLSASLNSSDFYFSRGYEFEEPVSHRLRSGTEIRCLGMSKALRPDAPSARTKPQMPIYLVPYDETWPSRFEDERSLILREIGTNARGIEHIGSTAIPGISAKPIIDVMVLIDDVSVAPNLFGALERIEYHYFPYDERRTPERRWFCKPNGLQRTHHLHLTEIGSPHHRNQILFRDYLRRHQDEVERYETLKRNLALRFPNDREAYTEGKSEFVREILTNAKAL